MKKIKEEIQYDLSEHVSDLFFKLHEYPRIVYGEPTLSIEGIVQELGLFFKHNGCLK